ncbi:MAG: hypothetical protein IIB59_04555 [Planctomycetes bacterium]|nr:hypothetical protein [Planctomycetota bacterium]
MTDMRVLVLRAAGINCDEEIMHCWRLVGAKPTLVHVNVMESPPTTGDGCACSSTITPIVSMRVRHCPVAINNPSPAVSWMITPPGASASKVVDALFGSANVPAVEGKTSQAYVAIAPGVTSFASTGPDSPTTSASGQVGATEIRVHPQAASTYASPQVKPANRRNVELMAAGPSRCAYPTIWIYEPSTATIARNSRSLRTTARPF